MIQVKFSKDDVLNFVKLNGPSVPNDIKKKLGSDTMIIGAMLSELVGEKKLKVSNTKVGGSPAYYAPGQESRLQNIAKYLNEKDQRAYELLRGRAILRDYSLSPLMRVAMRSIRDFAIPVEVSVGGQREIFWKWYLLSNQQAETMIKQQLHVPEKKLVPKEEKPVQDVLAKKEVVQKQEHIKPQQPDVADKPAVLEKKAPEQKTLVQKELLPTKEEPAKEKAKQKPRKEKTSLFLEQVNAFFAQNLIEIIETNIIKKSSEIDFIITVPSAIGKAQYYCKAKSKKSITEGDLSTAYVTGESKKLPVLFLSNGTLSKRAKEMLAKEFKRMNVQEIR
ncbi:MAG: hypothetical protein V1743_05065 [Nanoarchaeota archaeon]